jgi:hypothetical protein
VNEVRGVIEVKGLAGMTFEEIFSEIETNVGAINLSVLLDLSAAFVISFFPIPAAGGVVGDEFIEAPIAGGLAHLTPFSCHAGGIAGLF